MNIPLIVQAALNTIILIVVINVSESNIRSAVSAEIQKLTPVISEGRAYFSGVCVKLK